MRIANITINTKNCLQLLWNQKAKITLFTTGFNKSNLQKNYKKI